MANLFGLTISLLLFLTLFFFQPSLWIWNVLLTCSPHPDTSGNASADATAKNIATCPAQPLCLTYSHIHDNSPTSSLTDTQPFATLKNVYHICLVSLAIILHLHGSARMNNTDFSIFFFSPSLCHINACVTRRGAERNKWELVYYRVHFSRSKILWSISNNPGKTCKVEALATHPPLDRPFEHIMMDFSGLTPSKGKKKTV